MWRRGGSVESLTQSLQDILAFIATRYTRDSFIWVSCMKFRSFMKMFTVFLLCFRHLLVQVQDVNAPEETPPPAVTPPPVDQKARISSVGGREIKDKLTELFTPNKFKSSPKLDSLPTAAPTEMEKNPENSGSLEWSTGYMPRGRSEISEACRQAFTATCHLLLEATTFPIYLTEEESQELHTAMFDHTGQSVNKTFMSKPPELL